MDVQTRIQPFSVQSLQVVGLEFEVFTTDTRMLRVKGENSNVGDFMENIFKIVLLLDAYELTWYDDGCDSTLQFDTTGDDLDLHLGS